MFLGEMCVLRYSCFKNVVAFVVVVVVIVVFRVAKSIHLFNICKTLCLSRVDVSASWWQLPYFYVGMKYIVNCSELQL